MRIRRHFAQIAKHRPWQGQGQGQGQGQQGQQGQGQGQEQAQGEGAGAGRGGGSGEWHRPCPCRANLANWTLIRSNRTRSLGQGRGWANLNLVN